MFPLIVLALLINATFTKIVKGPQEGTFSQGTDILLTCNVVEKSHQIIWREVDTRTKIFIEKQKNTKMPKFTNFEISPLEGNYSLIIRNACSSDEGEYSCQEGDQHMTALITIGVKPTLALIFKETYKNIDRYTTKVGNAINVSCRAKTNRPNVSLELKFGQKGWMKPISTQQQTKIGTYFETLVTHEHVVSRLDNPFSCRTIGLSVELQVHETINILYKPNCSIIRSADNVECLCEANPPVYEYTMLVDGETKGVNESLSLSDYAPANFSCSGVNSIGTGYSTSQFISNAPALGIILVLSGMVLFCPFTIYLIVRYRKRRVPIIPENVCASSSTFSKMPDMDEENSYQASIYKTNRVIDDSVDIYAQVYANTPKESFVPINHIQFGEDFRESGYLKRWIGKLHSVRDVIVSSPRANASLMTQLNWVAFVKSLLDLPKIAYIVHVEGICIEMGRFYLLQKYEPTGTLRKKLTSIMYKSIKRNEEVTSTSSLLLQLASSLIHGIEFIQHHNFYHPGLSSDEVLVSNDNTCKLYNFCTADFLQDRVDDIIGKGEEGVDTRTLPPEAVFKRVYDKASEMWSLAATLWEIFTHGQRVKFNHLKELSLQDPLEGVCTLKKPHNLDNDLYEIMTKCWSKQPHYRPTISQLKHKVDAKISPRRKEFDGGLIQSGESDVGDFPQEYEPMTVGAKINQKLD